MGLHHTALTIGALSAAAVDAAIAAAETVGCSSRQPNRIRVTAHLQQQQQQPACCGVVLKSLSSLQVVMSTVTASRICTTRKCVVCVLVCLPCTALLCTQQTCNAAAAAAKTAAPLSHLPCTAAAAQRPNTAPSATCATAMAGIASRLAGCAAVRVLVVLASSMAGMVTLNATCSKAHRSVSAQAALLDSVVHGGCVLLLGLQQPAGVSGPGLCMGPCVLRHNSTPCNTSRVEQVGTLGQTEALPVT